MKPSVFLALFVLGFVAAERNRHYYDRPRYYGGGGGGSRVVGVEEETQTWRASEVSTFKDALNQCGDLYRVKVSKCFATTKVDLQLSSDFNTDITNGQAIQQTSFDARYAMSRGGWCWWCGGSGGGGSGGHKRHEDEQTAVEFSHHVQESGLLQATDDDLEKACDCFSNALTETIAECKIRHVVCKTEPTCSPVDACPTVQPTCSIASKYDADRYALTLSSLAKRNTEGLTYHCSVDYCTEGTGQCAHTWSAQTGPENRFQVYPAKCSDNAETEPNKNVETHPLKARCHMYRPNKRATTYTAIMTATSISSSGLNAGAIAGIVIGALCALVLVGALVGYLVFRKSETTYH